MIKRMRYPLCHFENEGREATVSSDKRAKRGFSLMETLAALLIVVMLTGFVATSLPVAFRTYRQVVGVSNAQAALSTTASALRDELGMAVAIGPTSDGVVLYQKSDGTWVKIENGTGTKGLIKHVYRDEPGGDSATEVETVNLIPEEAIVGAAGGQSLNVRMSGIEYDPDNGAFTVRGLEVLVDGKSQESISEYKVKAVLNPKSA